MARNHALHGPRGTRNGASKLNEDKVRVIRQRFDRGENRRQIARDYGINVKTVYCVADGRLWSWLD